MNDMRMYAILHQHMMNYCKKTAEDYIDMALELQTDGNDDVYWKTRRQKLLLLAQLGRNEESINNQLCAVKNNENVREYELLTTAYLLAGKFEDAYDWFKKTIKNSPAIVSFCFVVEIYVRNLDCLMMLLSIGTKHLK